MKQSKKTFAEIQAQVRQEGEDKNLLPPVFTPALDLMAVDGESQVQLEAMRRLPGVRAVFVFPDIHPGKGVPTGSTLVSQSVFYPHLAGSDLGCGIALFKIIGEVNQKKLVGKKERWMSLEILNNMKEIKERLLSGSQNKHQNASKRYGVTKSLLERLVAVITSRNLAS